MPDYSFRWDNYNHPNLVLAYDGVRTSGGLMKDMSRNGFDGTITGTINNAYPLLRDKKTPSMDFVPNARIVVNDDPRLYITRPTIVAWFNADTLSGRGILSKGNSLMSTLLPYALYLTYSANTMIMLVGNGAGSYIPSITQERLVTGRTYFAAGVVNDNFVETYLNGRLSSRLPRTIDPFDDSQVLIVGDMTTLGGGPFDGRIDAVRLYNVPLTRAQIWSIYRSGVPR